MKCFPVVALLAVTAAWAIVAVPSYGQTPTVNVSLNLRYVDPANPAEGGAWQFVARTDSLAGLSGIDAYVQSISGSGPQALIYGNGTTITAQTLGAVTDEGKALISLLPGGIVNFVYGQDTFHGPIVLDVARGADTPGNVPVDSLGSATWNNSALIASGSFGASRPAFVTYNGRSTDANTLPSRSTTPPVTGVVNANLIPIVRGDSVAVDGRKRGDVNRDLRVDARDFLTIQREMFGSGRTWDQGDVTDGLAGHVEGLVNDLDLQQWAVNFGSSSSVAAVPEPHVTPLVATGLVTAGCRARRRSELS